MLIDSTLATWREVQTTVDHFQFILLFFKLTDAWVHMIKDDYWGKTFPNETFDSNSSSSVEKMALKSEKLARRGFVILKRIVNPLTTYFDCTRLYYFAFVLSVFKENKPDLMISRKFPELTKSEQKDKADFQTICPRSKWRCRVESSWFSIQFNPIDFPHELTHLSCNKSSIECSRQDMWFTNFDFISVDFQIINFAYRVFALISKQPNGFNGLTQQNWGFFCWS